jgi:aryl-alcohol dehydrogenase-like predicted oxidoreductase
VVIATKGGITRSEGEQWGRNGSLQHLRSAVEKSLRALQVDVIDLYQWHRPDRWMLYSDVIENFRTLQQDGKIKTIGISNANIEEIEVAQQVLGDGGLVSVQNEFSPAPHRQLRRTAVLRRAGHRLPPVEPAGRTGGAAREVGQRFSVFADVGSAHGVSPQQAVLAWELSLGDHVIPIPGASRTASITDSAAAADLTLTEDEINRCSAAVGLEPDS